MRTKLAQGAEAIIYKEGNTIRKSRMPKTYRHPKLDSFLRSTRTRHEANILSKLKDFPTAQIKNVDEKNAIIETDFIEGKLVRDVLEKNLELTTQIGKNVALLHAKNIIHGDLTTSNMIVKDKVYFIDFGLSFISLKIEDKAVDLHLLDRALESKHYTIYPEAFNRIINEYRKHYIDADKVLARFEGVKKRGRNKAKY